MGCYTLEVKKWRKAAKVTLKRPDVAVKEVVKVVREERKKEKEMEGKTGVQRMRGD